MPQKSSKFWWGVLVVILLVLLVLVLVLPLVTGVKQSQLLVLRLSLEFDKNKTYFVKKKNNLRIYFPRNNNRESNYLNDKEDPCRAWNIRRTIAKSIVWTEVCYFRMFANFQNEYVHVWHINIINTHINLDLNAIKSKDGPLIYYNKDSSDWGDNCLGYNCLRRQLFITQSL